MLPRTTLIAIYTAFVWSHLDYGDIWYNHACNLSFHDILEYVQYNTCLAITGAIRGTMKEKLYQELALESLRLQHWYKKLCPFYKLFKIQHPQYPLTHSVHNKECAQPCNF